jgi:prevent-host-death family protein
MTTMTVSEARAALQNVLQRVAEGEEVTITRHGKPVAVVVGPDALRLRRADHALESAARVRDLLGVGRSSPLPRDNGVTEARADEIVTEIRAGRDRS